MKRSPNLALTIFLYVAAVLLVVMSIVLFIQALNWVVLPQEAIMSLVLLSIGIGILLGLRNR